MKRYLIFGFDRYYPAGGMHDLRAQTDTLEGAYDYLEGIERPPETSSYRYPHDYYEVWDMQTGDKVHEVP